MKVYFSNIFKIKEDIIESYGAFNISLINDLPLFIDPFLLFNSKKPEYINLHQQILDYVAFLRDQSVSKNSNIPKGLLKAWYTFPEIKQNWLGYSKTANKGRGPGMVFAHSLNESLSTIFKDFDNCHIASPHFEKLYLIKDNIGKDNISDFVTNLIHAYLLSYTEKFTKQYIDKKYKKEFNVSHVRFNYNTKTWTSEKFTLPIFNDDYVLLTPIDMLSKNDTWINKNDLQNSFVAIATSMDNDQLREQLNDYFVSQLPKRKNKKGKDIENTPKEKTTAIFSAIKKYPEFLDYYIKFKEDHGDDAVNISQEYVQEVKDIFINKLSKLIYKLIETTDFYKEDYTSKDGSYARIMFLKDIIENKDGYKIFYHNDIPIKKESDLQILYRLTWFASNLDVNREVNNGRGSVDFKISNGAKDISLVEFKLASNSQLKRNLVKQVEIYAKANNTNVKYKVIIFFSEEEKEHVLKILNEIGLYNNPNIIMIDANKDNKISASKA